METQSLGVAMIEPVGGHGGMNYYDFGLCGGLQNASVEVTLYTCDETDTPPSLPFEVNNWFKNIFGEDDKWIRALRYVRGLLASLFHAKRQHLAITHFHIFQVTILEWLSVKIAKWLGFRIVITAHDVESFSKAENLNRVLSLYHLADRIIAHNVVSKKELVGRLGLPEQNIDIIPHGSYITTIQERLSKTLARNRLGVGFQGPILLFFGQIKKVKGLEVLLEALAIVKEKVPDIKLIIAGKLWNNDFSEYEPIIKRHDLESNLIQHIRYIPVQAVDSYFCAADLVVLPYRKIYQSGVLLQSMSYRKPVIVSNIEGMTEVVKANVNGYVFEEGRPESLADRILFALNNEQDRESVAEAGYHTVVRYHNWDEIGRTTAQSYMSLINS